MKIDFIVIRHESAGAPHFLTTFCRSIVINAGDGGHEHPTQALLDMMTLREKFGNLKGLTVAIVGDILHSRVALSNIYGLKTMGANVIVCGPATLIPKEIEKLGVEVTSDVNEAIRRSDALNILRIQLERQTTGQFPTLREYHHQWGITNERLKNAKKQLAILHPGPINRGVELSSDVADGERSVILQQVNYGVAVRMAVLTLLNGVEI
jgi:aspartate carbamoyltransferase catalytic subunit